MKCSFFLSTQEPVQRDCEMPCAPSVGDRICLAADEDYYFVVVERCFVESQDGTWSVEAEVVKRAH